MAHRRDRIKQMRQTVNLLNNSLIQLEQTAPKPTHNNGNPFFQTTKANIFNVYPASFHSTCSVNQCQGNKQNAVKPKRRRQFETMDRSISSSLKHTMKSIDKAYYNSKEKTFNHTSLFQFQSTQTIKRNKGAQTQKRFKPKPYEHNQEKSFKLKTYQLKKTDLIVNPEQFKQKGKKIFNKIQRSPNLMLSAHPNSNQSAFSFNSQEYILPKRATKSKTKSSITMSPTSKQMIPAKHASVKQTSKQSQKKHYERYSKQILTSQIQD